MHALLCALPLAVLLTILLPGPVLVHAQQRGAILVVAVHIADSGGPLAGALVTVEGTGAGGIVDARGILRLTELPPGDHRVVVNSIGYTESEADITLSAGETHTLSVILELRPIELTEVEARARAGVRRLTAVGFYTRQSQGPGAFITRQQIEKRQPRQLSDMLRMVSGVQLSATRFSDSRASMGRSTLPSRRCPIQYILDGVPVHGFNIDDVPPRDVEGIEIYRGAAELPPQFNQRTAMCGAIAIWTRID